MKKYLFIVLSVLMLSGCAMFDDWSKTDKALLSTYLVAQTIDTLQTRYIYANPDKYYEVNPIITNYFDSKDGATIYMVGSAVSVTIVADLLPSKYRTLFLGGATAFETGIIIHNNSIGIGFEF